MIKKPQHADYIWRYMPRYDFQTFEKQLERTQNELIEYMPNATKIQYENFMTVERTVAAGFWILDITFVTFCHRISLVKRVFKHPWAMFLFKLAMIGGPLYLTMEIEREAKNQQIGMIYNEVKRGYRMYKRNGDLLELNPDIELVYDGTENLLEEQ